MNVRHLKPVPPAFDENATIRIRIGQRRRQRSERRELALRRLSKLLWAVAAVVVSLALWGAFWYLAAELTEYR